MIAKFNDFFIRNTTDGIPKYFVGISRIDLMKKDHVNLYCFALFNIALFRTIRYWAPNLSAIMLAPPS